MIVLGEELDIEGTGDIERLDDVFGDVLRAPDGLKIRALWRQDDRRIPRVCARILDMLRKHIDDEFAVLGDAVDFDFACILDELRNNNRIFTGYVSSFF